MRSASQRVREMCSRVHHALAWQRVRDMYMCSLAHRDPDLFRLSCRCMALVKVNELSASELNTQMMMANVRDWS